jgi:hypothetical protein
MLKMKKDYMENQVRELQTFNNDLKTRVQTLEQQSSALLFRIDNGMYEGERPRISE